MMCTTWNTLTHDLSSAGACPKLCDCERRYPKTSKRAGIPDSGSDAEAFKHKCGAADASPLYPRFSSPWLSVTWRILQWQLLIISGSHFWQTDLTCIVVDFWSSFDVSKFCCFGLLSLVRLKNVFLCFPHLRLKNYAGIWPMVTDEWFERSSTPSLRLLVKPRLQLC
jgi:hypothetical protein